MAIELEERWQQQVHKRCGGEIVVIVKLDQMAWCCKMCRAIWLLPQQTECPPDWAVPDPVKIGSRLWMPGQPKQIY